MIGCLKEVDAEVAQEVDQKSPIEAACFQHAFSGESSKIGSEQKAPWSNRLTANDVVEVKEDRLA